MAYIYSLADTWNASGTTFTGIGLNVTDSASSAGSLLMDLRVGGVSKFSVTKAGLASLSSLNFPRLSGGEYIALANEFYVGAGGGITVAKNWPFIKWADISGTSISNTDLILTRDAANTLAQRNGVNGQAFNLYNSYTDVSNYSRLVMYADGSANYYIGTQKAGTGISASLFVGTGAGAGVAGNGSLTLAGATVQISTQFGNVFNISAAGVLSWNSDNTNDIGGSAGNRPRSVYVATSVTPGRGVTVAGLPTPSTGMIARVTDALAPTIGTTVAGGGAAYALVNYNGTNWTVIGV